MDEYSKPAAARVAPTVAEEPSAAFEGEAEAVSEAELREFLAADTFGAPADPEFKRRLKGRLWEVVEAQLQSKLRGKWTAGWRRRQLGTPEDASRITKQKR